MKGHHIKLTIRNFIKNKLLFGITILGLSIGIAVSMLLFSYNHYENSFDGFYPQTENLYRINFTGTKEGKQIINSCRTQSALSRTIGDESELIAASTHILYEECYMYTDKVKLYGQQVLWADSAFLNVFQLPMISGNPSTALANKYSTVISEDVSKKYFGTADPIGKVIKLNEGIPFTVAGVFRSLPSNTHLHYDFLVSFITLSDYGANMDGNWRGNSLSTYFRRIPLATETSINRYLKEVSDKYLANRNKDGETATYSIIPVKDIYLHSKFEAEYQRIGSETKLMLVMIIAMFILVIAWANSINISTALSFERVKESGILKLHGANNLSLARYYITEAIILNLISVFLSLLIFILCIPAFKSIVGDIVSIHLFTQWWFWKSYSILFVASVLFTGVLTSLTQVKVNPLKVLKKEILGLGKMTRLKRSLAVFQFTLAIVLIIVTLGIGKQINFIEKQDLGMKADQVLVMRGPATNNTSGNRRYQEFCAFRDELVQSPYVKSVTASMNIPGQANRYSNVVVSKNGEDVNASFNVSYADNNYFDTYQVPIIAGRNFRPEIENEAQTIIINEKSLLTLGFDSPEKAIGKNITIGRTTREIIGVVRNFHHESLQKEIEPYLYQFKHPHEFGYYPALVSTANVPELMKYVTRVWKDHYPDAQADFFFLDKYFNEQYLSYRQLGKIMGIGSALAILIACMGLFAFVTYTVNHKIKEIGIRKVNGARISEILAMLNKDFMKWVLIAFVLATPLAWYAMSKWLETFAYKTTLSWWIFAIAGLLATGIALFTVSWQSWRAATKNPVEALRYE